MNTFDVVVVAVAIVVIVIGFSAGLLRSLATILGYLIAAPLAVAIAPLLATLMAGQHIMPSDPLSSGQAPSSWMSSNQNWLVLCITFIASGIVISALLRVAVGEFAGREIGLFDRLAGAALGAVRIGRADRRDLRPRHPGRPPAAIPRQLAAAAVSVGGRTKGTAILAAGDRRLHRSVAAPARNLAGPGWFYVPSHNLPSFPR
jgi:hypothetical protein